MIQIVTISFSQLWDDISFCYNNKKKKKPLKWQITIGIIKIVLVVGYKNNVQTIFHYLSTWKGDGKCLSPKAISVQVLKN